MIARAAESGRFVRGMAVGVVLLIGSGAGYRTLAGRYNLLTASVPLPPGTLARLPLQLGDWMGREMPLDEAVVRATDTDDHVNREYRHRHGQPAVSLFVAYGVNLRDLAPHRPEVCYPGAGWTLQETRKLTLTTADQSDLPCRVHRFKRGGLVRENITVLNYYIVDGKYCPDVSLLRSKAWRLSLQAKYAAQVQIVCGGSHMDPRGAEAATKAFAADSAPAIRDLLVAAVELAGGG